MKKIFVTSVVLCVISFICFGISTLIVGRNHNAYTSHVYYESPNNYGTEKGTVFSGDYSTSGTWTILNQFPDININSAGINTIITRGESDRIRVRLDNPDQKTIHVEAVYAEGSLTLEARSTNITFISDGEFGLVNWLEDIFAGKSSEVTVIIEFPETKYESLNIQQGSGSIKVHELYADYNKFHIGSGSFEFLRRSKGFVSNYFGLELGSGSAVISGMQTESYRIDIGSGKFDINGISGEGEIEMSSGSGSIAYKEYNGDGELDIGSGSIKLYLPDNSSVEINADVSSGSVSVDACGVKNTITSQRDDETVCIGDGEYSLVVDMSSGHASILDMHTYPAPVIEEIVISSYYDDTSSSDTVSSSSSSRQTEQSTDIILPATAESSEPDSFSSTELDITDEGENTAQL